jgi:hypothetical protein
VIDGVDVAAGGVEAADDVDEDEAVLGAAVVVAGTAVLARIDVRLNCPALLLAEETVDAARVVRGGVVAAVEVACCCWT